MLRREQKREGEEVKEEKRRGEKRERLQRIKGEYIRLLYLNSTHHGGVEFYVPFYIT